MKKQRSAWPIIKGYKFNSLLLKNFAYVFVLVTLPLLLVLTLNYNNFRDVVNKRVKDMNEELLLKNASVTDNIFAGLLETADRVAQLNEVVELVQSENTDAAYYSSVEQVIKLAEAHTTSNNLVSSYYIYSDVNEMLIDNYTALHIDQISPKAKWYDIHKREPMVFPYIMVNHADSIFVCQPIWSHKGQRSGLLVLDVELQQIRQLLEAQEFDRQGIFFVMDISGQTIYCNEQDYRKWDDATSSEYRGDIAQVGAGETRMFAEHGQRIVSVMKSQHKSWQYAFVTELPDYKEEMGAVSGFLLTSVLVGLVSSLIVAYIITILTYRPMRKIMNVINNPKLHWNEEEATKESNELLYITSSILADRGEPEADEEASEELEERIRALRQAQFRALQFQIDPHFLYNTLETIKWSAVEEMGLGNKVSKMLTKVARLYRLGLENDDVIVTLKEELEFLKLYIEIVRIRFGDSIRFHWAIDDSLLSCNIIKMCLQPIVENAIQHGLRPKNYLGNITISAQYRDECLRICIANDGEAMADEKLDTLNKTLKTGSGFEESKVGLRNVNERIKLVYGKDYGVSVSRSEGGEDPEAQQSTQVVLTFPCRNLNRSEETK